MGESDSKCGEQGTEVRWECDPGIVTRRRGCPSKEPGEWVSRKRELLVQRLGGGEETGRSRNENSWGLMVMSGAGADSTMVR